MLSSGTKYFALCTTKKSILPLVFSEKKILNETKNHTPPPFQAKWSVPNSISKSPSKYFVIHSVRRHSITSSPVSKNTPPLLITRRFPTHIPINGVIRRIFTKTHKKQDSSVLHSIYA